MAKEISINADEIKINDFLTKEREKALCYLERNYSLDNEDAKDVFQESSLALFMNIKNGKLVNLTSTLSTYFLKICINQARKSLRKNKNTININEVIELKQKDEYNDSKIDELLGFGEENITDEQKNIMRNLVQNLPKPCDDILWYFYGDNLDMQTIADMLNYKGADSVKTTKSRCMSKLKEKFNQIKNDFYEK